MGVGCFLDSGNRGQFWTELWQRFFLMDKEQLAPPLRAREDRMGWTPVGQEFSVNGGGFFS